MCACVCVCLLASVSGWTVSIRVVQCAREPKASRMKRRHILKTRSRGAIAATTTNVGGIRISQSSWSLSPVGFIDGNRHCRYKVTHDDGQSNETTTPFGTRPLPWETITTYQSSSTTTTNQHNSSSYNWKKKKQNNNTGPRSKCALGTRENCRSRWPRYFFFFYLCPHVCVCVCKNGNIKTHKGIAREKGKKGIPPPSSHLDDFSTKKRENPGLLKMEPFQIDESKE